MDDVHLLMIALAQLNRCFTALSSERIPFRGEVKRFLSWWRAERVVGRLPAGADHEREWTSFVEQEIRLSEIRNLLEHEIDYITGHGRYPDLIGRDWAQESYPEAGANIAPSMFWIRLLGVDYLFTGEEIEELLRLEDALQAFIQEEEANLSEDH
jgi:hypothetical protein